MIINSDTRVTYRGDGTNKTFPFSFPFIDAKYICVKIREENTGHVTKLESDYFVDTVGKNVIYPGYQPGQEPAQEDQPPILPETSTITIYRNTEISQLIELGEKFPLPIIESALDKITEILQEQQDGIKRSVKVDETSSQTSEELIAGIKRSVKAAADSASNAATSEENAKSSEDNAKASEENAAASEDRAEEILQDIETAAAAVGGVATVYDPAKTYQPADQVMIASGDTYRCIATSTGEYPPESGKWVLTAIGRKDTFERDSNDDLMPCKYAQASGIWKIDSDEDIYPAEIV